MIGGLLLLAVLPELTLRCLRGPPQALARWRSVESALIYARLNPGDCTGWVSKAMAPIRKLHGDQEFACHRRPQTYAALQAASTFFARSDDPPDHDEAAIVT
jgi:hypothetical protein